ncbi:MAG: HD domain-containing protein [Candidatus Hydrogenedentota bacterium]|jgi:HD superfamily phosphohydrolase|uniref:Deoxyguanosinetriphosphate triphosphohydrolase n=1 Tax=Sumerlaea chitinivorans TaxID=2250252 RepID=A0A2Z4Y491_SUMC1|nr:Deoxyguanosinetriphosphate triphosphohydrolase [Candidatus Sumerlaea chitinivorans]RMH27573.1 MAG: HD domain-containing protein [Candidatus Hydrogenedentota bacterium]GIX44539.1 MAG: phosphohydrolase [Candidatus Sumerlaea sp.]
MIIEKLYRDPVHDIIALDKTSREDRLLMELIDTPELQRLRRIRQLGFASLAYQGAEHSRFTHSLGVMWIATRILQQLRKEWPISPQQSIAVRCAALLHDIGHGPFSHLFEAVTGIHHEHWTQLILLNPNTKVHRALAAYSPALPRMVSQILLGRSKPPFLSQIITSQLDADRFDYLLRDSIMTGVKYGIYDLERLLKVLRLDQHGERIVIAPNGLHPVEKYLQARYHMFTQVYLHKTVRAAENMLILLLRRARELLMSKQIDAQLVTPLLAELLCAGDQIALPHYLGVTDDTLMTNIAQWQEAPDPILSDLASRLCERNLFKTIDISGVTNLASRIRKAKREIEALGLDSRYYFVLDESRSVAYQPYSPRTTDPARHIMIEVQRAKSVYRDIHEVSPIIEGLARATAHIRRVIFPERVRKTNLRKRMEAIFLS